MCNVQMKDWLKNEELRKRVDVENIIEVVGRKRLRWCGHVERTCDEDWVKICMKMEMNGKRKRGRQRFNGKRWWRRT